MKILISAFTYWPAVDGVQNVTQYQAEGLAARGHDVTVLTGFLPDKDVPRRKSQRGTYPPFSCVYRHNDSPWG